LSARHGFSTYLFKREADLAGELRNAIEFAEQKHNGAILRALEEALIEDPAPTVRMVEARLECTITVMRKLYPAIVAKIAARSMRHKNEDLRKKRKELEQEVLKIAATLNEARMPPRYDCVISMLGANSHKKWDDISTAIRKARKTLGLEPAKRGPRPKIEK
jgi:hypothetical protein